MKKCIAFILSIIMCLSFCSCKSKTEKAQELYSNLNNAYTVIDKISEDICTVWLLAVENSSSIRNGGVEYLASKLNLSEEDINETLAKIHYEAQYGDWDKLSDETKTEYWLEDTDTAKWVLKNYSDKSSNFGVPKYADRSFFSFCVVIVVETYTTTGELDEAQNLINLSKNQVEEFDKNYEHYQNLKEYYVAISALFELCINPEGSLKEYNEYVEGYRTDVRENKDVLKAFLE